RLISAQSGQKRRYDTGRIPAKFVVGDQVLYDSQPTHVFDFKRRPEVYRVLSVEPNDVCQIETVDGRDQRTVHVTQLRAFKDTVSWTDQPDLPRHAGVVPRRAASTSNISFSD